MKKLISGAAILYMLFSSHQSSAQQNDIQLFVTDMLRVADDFASPAAEGASYLSGGGWFSSARNLELWEVDLSLHANALFIPGKKRNSTVSSSAYAVLDIRGAETATIPTAFGGQTDVYFEGTVNVLGNPIGFDFQAIEGIDKQVGGNPFLQAAVGLPLGSELIVRYSPKITIDEVEYGTYGIGLKHNFNQYFLNTQPTDFQFAALVSYSKFDVDYTFSPLVIEMIAEMDRIEVDANLWLLQLISSRSFLNSNWEVLGAVGVTNSSFGYTLGGGGFALGQINTALETLNKNEVEVKGDLGFNYRAGDFLVSSMFSVGKFLNYNLGLHYRL